MPFCYIIYSKKLNKYYTGACTEIERRLYEHNIGHSKFTATGIPWVLVYSEVFETLQMAKQRAPADVHDRFLKPPNLLRLIARIRELVESRGLLRRIDERAVHS